MRDFYKPISKYYDLLSRVYSFGRIPRCRGAFVSDMVEGVRVCFVGVGYGSEAIEAAQKGAEVTVVDLSESMLEGFREKLAGCDDEVRGRVTVVHDDVRNVSGTYDWVVANFFLNVFEEAEMLVMLESLLGLCAEDGSLVVGDFCYESEKGLVVRMLQNVNWYFPLIIFRMLVRNAWHSVYDYEQPMADLGWGVAEKKSFGILGLNLYESVRFRRSA